MFRMGLMELFVIFLAVVLLFGVKSLPEVARGLGLAIKNLRKALQDPDHQEEEAKTDKDRQHDNYL